MRRPGIGAALLMVVLMASTSGCMGLIAARESVESLREPAYESMNNRKITVTHEFTSLTDYANEYTNRSTFAITDQTTEIGVYFKVSFELSQQPSFHLLGQRKPLRSRHADRQRGLGTVGARRQRGRQPA